MDMKKREENTKKETKEPTWITIAKTISIIHYLFRKTEFINCNEVTNS
jgi:hypothetical protein